MLRDSGIVKGTKQCQVLGSGSLSGVDPARFRPDAPIRAAVRRELEIAPGATVFATLYGIEAFSRALIAGVIPLEALALLGDAPWTLAPAVAIFLVVLGVNIVVRDPRTDVL